MILLLSVKSGLRAKEIASITWAMVTDPEGNVGNSIAHWFKRLYGNLGFDGCSSHSGRRTAITRWAKNTSKVGGSLKDVQDLAGHVSLATTQRYIQSDFAAKRKLVDMG